MTSTPKKPNLPPRLAKRQNAGGKLSKLLSKLPSLKGLSGLQQKGVDQSLTAHKSQQLEKGLAAKPTVQPQKLAAGGVAKSRLGQSTAKGVVASVPQSSKATKPIVKKSSS